MNLSIYFKALPGILILGVALLLPGAGANSPGLPPTAIAGQTVTLLSDGRWLLMGGQGLKGSLATVTIQDPATGRTTILRPLRVPRSGHSATVLPEGDVLVVGGLGDDGQLLTTIEHYDPASQSSNAIPSVGLTARAYHSATLLTNGRVLLAGGVSPEGKVFGDAELYDPLTSAVEPVAEPLTTPRRGATASLLADGRVLIWGGLDARGATLTTGELFDPAHSRFARLTVRPTPPDPGDSPSLQASDPATGSADVSSGSLVALRFSKPLRVDPTTAGTVTLSGPLGSEPVTVVVAEAGRLVFVSPHAALAPNTTYTVTVNSAVDVTGLLVPFTSVVFQTAPLAAGGGGRVPTLPAAMGHFHPANAVTPGAAGETDEWQWHGPLCDGEPCPLSQKLPPLKAPRGVTALSGQMLRLNGDPLAEATLKIGDRSVRTDRTGRFLLTNIAAGDQVLIMDGSTANRPGRSYAIFEYYVDIEERETTVLPFTIWMPLLDTRNATAIPVPTPKAMVVTTPVVPGLELRIPGNVILQTLGGPLRSIPLTRIPVDRPPFPLPKGSTFSFTPQAHGALVQRPDGTPNSTGVRIILPNLEGLPAGTRVGLQSYEPAKGWFVYGQGLVSADGTQIVPDAGVEFHRVTCFFPLGSVGNVTFAAAKPGGIRAGEPVDLATGIFTMEKVDLALPDVIPIVIRREYRQNDTAVRGGGYGVGQSHFYQMMLVGDYTTFGFAELVLANGARIHYRRTSPGTDQVSAVMEHTGSVNSPVTPTGFYASVLRWNAARPGWDLTFTDGTIYQFAPTGHLGNQLTGIQDRVGNQLTVSRSGTGTYGDLITRITSPNGRWVDFVYGASTAQVTQIRDNLGRTVSYTYDTQSRLVTATDAGGGVTQYSYHSQGALYALIQTIRDARNITYLTNVWDLQNRRVVGQTQADGTTFQFIYTVDGQGRITRTDMNDPRGTVRRLTFNGAGYPLTDTRAHGSDIAQTTTYVRDATSNFVTSITDALGRHTDLTYDTKGNLLTLSRLAGTAQAVTTAYTYEPTFSLVTSVTDPLSHTTSMTYDAVGNLSTITNPLSQVTALTYTSSGQPLTITTPAGTTRLGYDRGDVTTITDAVGNTTARFTDDGGRLTSLTTALGHRTRFEYDALNQLRKMTDPLGGQTQLTYDPNGNLLDLTDARGGVTSYAYNPMDRATTRTDPLVRSESYAYDGNGNPTARIDRKGQVTSRAYDAIDRPTQVSYQDGSTTLFTWDAGNRLTQIVDSLTGTIARTYDMLDRLIQEVTPQGTVSYTYDAVGRRTGLTVLGQPTQSYTYDAADRVTEITQGDAIVTLAYDSAGRRASLALPNGVSTEYAWDAASRLTGLTYKNDPGVLGALTYGYDAGGNRTVMSGTWAATGLPQAVASAIYDTANRPVTFGDRTLSHDLNGNLTNDGTNTYTWDARNQLVAIASVDVTASFGYDALGRRQAKTINGAATQFVYDRLNPVQETNGSTIKATLFSGLGIDEYFARADSTATSYLLTDLMGSTLALTDATGTPSTIYAYEPFGNAALSGAASNNSFMYTGRENDGTGLYYYRARYYHPALARFIGEDPLGFLGGDVNLYSYAANNPMKYVDPLGLDVTISLWRCCGGFDHIGIGVGSGKQPTKGFYPHTPGRFVDDGVVVADTQRKTWQDHKEDLVIPTTDEQDRKIEAFIRATSQSPGTYMLVGRNCGNFVQAALRAGGIDPVGDVLSPRSVFDLIKALQATGTDFTKGVAALRP